MMVTKVSVVYDGPPVCGGCHAQGAEVCDHIGLNPEAYEVLKGYSIHVPGLDPAWVHILRDWTMSEDRKMITLVVETVRDPGTDLGQHLSVLRGPKARVVAVDEATGDTLVEGRYDAPLVEGQLVYVNGVPHAVVGTEWPNRTEHGRPADGVEDYQRVRLSSQPVDEIQAASVVFDATAPDA
jgi:hypothetical protein